MNSSSESENYFGALPLELSRRLLAASHALPVEETLRDIADDVLDWDSEGLSDAQIDKRIVAWMEDNDFGYTDWITDLKKDMPELFVSYPTLDPKALWRIFGYEKWFIECIRSLAFTDEPIPFIPLSAGFWHVDNSSDPTLLIAVMTPLTDPQLAAKQLINNHRKLYGDKASKSSRKDEVENARMMKRHRQSMSYRDIAIQNLRNKYPDIVTRPHKYRKELERERTRVAKVVSAAEGLWKERLPESSTEE